MGEQLRAAGFATSKQIGKVVDEAERRGVNRWVRQRAEALRRWDIQTQTSARLQELGRRVLEAARRAFAEMRAWARRSGLTQFLQGLPARLRMLSFRIGLTTQLRKVGNFCGRLWRKTFPPA
uniref:Uncharacterized protein n=1 Tax=Haptolina ericina TaxID=156174 RepID=A0A7S3B3N0_9EUKA